MGLCGRMLFSGKAMNLQAPKVQARGATPEAPLPTAAEPLRTIGVACTVADYTQSRIGPAVTRK